MFCTVLPPPDEVIKNPNQYEHCRHCPRKDAWYLNGHRFMEDEEFSDMGRYTQITIFVLHGFLRQMEHFFSSESS